jgi:hypothetical protein
MSHVSCVLSREREREYVCVCITSLVGNVYLINAYVIRINNRERERVCVCVCVNITSLVGGVYVLKVGAETVEILHVSYVMRSLCVYVHHSR